MSKESRPTRRIPLPRRWVLAASLVVAAFVTVAVPVAWATDVFADVPFASPHHDDINSMAEAGITGGCAPGLYCPDQAVRRDQMASFLKRGLPRLSMDSTTNAVDLPITTAFVLIEQETTVVPGVAGTQYVKVDAVGQLNTGVSGGCPCTIGARIRQVSPEVFSPTFFFDVFVGPGADIDDTIFVSWPFQVASGTRTYELQMQAFDHTAALPVTNGAVMVQTFPFNQFGDGGALGEPGGGGVSPATTPDP